MAERRRALLIRVPVLGLIAAFGLTIFATTTVSVGPAEAAITHRVKNSCRKDYFRFCSKYSVGTPELKQCMRSNGRRLSRVCVEALVDAGEAPRKVLRKFRKRRSTRRSRKRRYHRYRRRN